MDKTEINKERREQNRLECFNTQNPCCEKCGESHSACFPRKPEPVECLKCQYIRKGKIKQPRKSKKSLVDYHACTSCGDENCYLEYHHLYYFTGKEVIIPTCINCHFILSDDQQDHPKPTKQSATEWEAFGLFILNLMDLYKLMVARQRNFAIISNLIFALAKECAALTQKLVEWEIAKAGKLNSP